MKLDFKASSKLLRSVREDLSRPHPFAYERVGFLSAGIASAGRDIIFTARNYRPLQDNDYLQDPSYGAMMGPDAIRSALQWAMETGCAIFHVHTHGGKGLPSFSGVDLSENSKFVPDFFKVTPQSAHGALVFSNNSIKGQVWLSPDDQYRYIDQFVEVGTPIRKWKGS